MNAKNRSISRFSFHSLLFLLLLLNSLAFADKPIVNGKIERIGPFRVVRVWGTPKEMGFAHGYLLGKDIISEMNADYAQTSEDDRRARDAGMQSLLPTIRVPDRLKEEVQGIYEGLVAAHGGKAPEIASLKRPFTVDDLILTNAGDMLRAFGCSGFTVWGDRAGDLGVITTRNFDYSLFTPTTLDTQFILVRQPKDAKQVALITWPGFIGAVTAINEHGVCAFMHDGTGPHINNPKGKYTPVALAMTELLERVTPDNAHADFETGLKTVTPYPFSYMLRVVSPRVPGKVEIPERVFHIDAQGLGENPPGKSTCITTNHYITKDGKPVPEANKWTLTRYKKLEEQSAGPVTVDSAWKALESVAGEAGRDGTLYSLVVFPEKRSLELAFASLVNGNIKAAPRNEKVKISFDELFAK